LENIGVGVDVRSDEQREFFALIRDGEERLDDGDPEGAEQVYRTSLNLYRLYLSRSRRLMTKDYQDKVVEDFKVLAVVGLARALQDQEKTAEAIETLRTEGNVAHHCIAEELALIVYEDDLEQALELLRSAPTSAWWAPDTERGRLRLVYAELLGQTDPTAAAVSLNENMELVEGYLRNTPDALVLVQDLAEVLWQGRWERESVGSGSYQDDPYEPDRLLRWAVDYGSPTVQERATQLKMEVLAVRGIESRGGGIPGWNLGGEFEQADRVRQLIDDEDLEQAMKVAALLVKKAPSAESLGLLGDVYWQQNKRDIALQIYAQAAAWELVPGEWYDRWLTDSFTENNRSVDPEMIRALERACQGVEPNPELVFRLAKAYRGVGRKEEARARFEQARRSLESVPGASAEKLTMDIDAELKDLETAEEDVSYEAQQPPIDPAWEQSISSLRVALAMAADGNQDVVRRAFKRARRLAPEKERLSAAQGAIAWFAGDTEATIKAWKKSLEWDSTQRSLWLALGKVYHQRGEVEEAREAFLAAANGGLADAWYLLALLEHGEGHDDQALEYLQTFEEGPKGRSGYSQEAMALYGVLSHEEDLSEASDPLYWTMGLVGVLLALLWWRTRKSDIHALLEKSPESSHDLARILSAIRHEVLKHNTTLLDEVADALEHGDHHAVSFAAIRLFGMPDSQDGGIPQRFDGYIRALERVGGRYRRSLDIRGDAILGPMVKSMEDLRDLEASLRRPWRAGSRVPDRLRRLSTDLNETAYRAIGNLLSSMGTLSLDRKFIEGVNERVCAEPGLSEHGLPDLEILVPDSPLPLRIFHGDLHDILANLLRNAWSAGMESKAPGVGVRVEEEEDPITGLEHVAIRVLDRAPGRLRTDQIHARGIGRGLGLSADLIARHDGSLDVEQRVDELEQGWTKAVVLRLRRVEQELEQELPRRALVEEVEE
jgi:tetratricopeptide (TPR) repeat protein